MNQVVLNGLSIKKLGFEGIPISGKWNSSIERQKGKNSIALQLCKLFFFDNTLNEYNLHGFCINWNMFERNFIRKFVFFLVFHGRRKNAWVSHHLLSFAWLFCEKLETCKHFYVDNEMENGKHWGYNSAMDTPDPKNLLEKLHFVFDSFKYAAKLNVESSFVLKNVADRKFMFWLCTQK